jgi:hypothetical protein
MARNFKLQRVNAEVFEGDDISIDVLVQDPDGVAVDVQAGHTAIWTVTDEAETVVIDSGNDIPTGIAAPTMGNGTLALVLTSAQNIAAPLSGGVYNLEVEITITGVPDVVETLAMGVLRVLVSRAGAVIP